MKRLKTGAAALALMLTSGAATAVTLNLTGSSADSSSKVFSDGGITVIATGFRQGAVALIQVAGLVTQSGAGLGVRSFPDTSGDVDGFGFRDSLLLDFDQNVHFDSVTFGLVDSNDDWDVFVDDGSGIFQQVASDSSSNPFLFPGEIKRIAFSADEANDDFRVAEITVSAVPLPAGGLLLISGLGAIALLRRKARVAA